jgi:hypothetical protein
MPANLLIVWGSNFRDFSECALINKQNHLDFDSAIPRFESWRPSQLKLLGYLMFWEGERNAVRHFLSAELDTFVRVLAG